MIEACAERGDTDGALQTLEMMRGARGSIGGVCPRPSYRSYLAALRACSRAPTSATLATDAASAGAGNGDGVGGQEFGLGDWQASKRVLGMMWKDEAARKAEEGKKAAVPGLFCFVASRVSFFVCVYEVRLYLGQLEAFEYE